MPLSSGLSIHDDTKHKGSAKRDTLNGVAAIDSNSDVVAVGNGVRLVRDGANRIYLKERTSGEVGVRFERIGANDYVGDIIEGGSAFRIQTASMKDVANGIAGLDASAKVLQAQMPYEALTVILFQVNAATGTAATPANANDNNTATSADFDTQNQYVEIDFKLRYLVTEFRHYGDSAMSGDGRYKIQHYVGGAWVDNTIGIATRVTNDWSGWVSLTSLIYTSRIRVVCTTVDSLGACVLHEVEMR